MKKVLILVFVSLLVLFVGNAFAIETITNGGFEDGLTGWSSTNVAAIGTHVYPYTNISFGAISPTIGDYQAVMGPPITQQWYNYYDSDLWQEFSIDPALYTEVTISFDYNLWAWIRVAVPRIGTDYLAVTYNTTELLTVSFQDAIEPWGPAYSSVRGWQSFSTTLPASELSGGPLTLNFHVQNTSPPGDLYQATVAFIDNVSIDATPIPEPATIILLGFGSLTLLRRKRRA